MSYVDSIRSYLTERYSAHRFVPLAIFLGGAGVLAAYGGAPPAGTAAVLRSVLIAWLTVLSLRIWDDLADRERDALLHPERITVRANSMAPFRTLSYMSMSFAAAVVAFGPRPWSRLVLLALLLLLLVLWYRSTLRQQVMKRAPVLAAHLLLLKYPAIVLVAMPAQSVGFGLSAIVLPIVASVYLLLCVYELIDDPDLRQMRSAKPVLFAECALMLPLVGTIVMNVFDLRPVFTG